MFKFAMTKEEIVSTVANLRNGTMARIKYVTELPMKAEFAKQGYKILKVTETTARFGVKYANLSAVKEKQSDSVKPERQNNYEWVVENKIAHNNNTNKDYIRFAPLKKYGSNKHTNLIFVDTTGKYFSFDGKELPTDFKNMVQNSYWNKNHETPDIQTVLLENVILLKTKSAK